MTPLETGLRRVLTVDVFSKKHLVGQTLNRAAPGVYATQNITLHIIPRKPLASAAGTDVDLRTVFADLLAAHGITLHAPLSLLVDHYGAAVTCSSS